MPLPVSRRAIEARARRKLERQDEHLTIARSAQVRQQYGRYLIIDSRLNAVIWSIDSTEGLADELNLLKPYEMCADDCDV